MKYQKLCLSVCFCLLIAASAPAAVLYVDVNSSSPTAPYTNWSTAATTIQDAVDAGLAGDEIVVTNGAYQIGSKTVPSGINRLAVDKPLSVRSVNGPQVTVIDGGRAVRCAYLTNGAGLSGFTLTNGYALDGDGGGAWCESRACVISNCVLAGNGAESFSCFACGNGGGISGGTVINCTLVGNWARIDSGGDSGSGLSGNGGGAHGSKLYNCTLIGNSASDDSGGGAAHSILYNCTLVTNFAGWGGGAADSTLRSCILTNNSASLGGGASGGTLDNCVLIDNRIIASGPEPAGGGAIDATLTNCSLVRNTAEFGGGAWDSLLYNCRLISNSAIRMLSAATGGGAGESTLYNCIIVGNSAGDSGGGVIGCTLNNCTVTGNSAGSSGGSASSRLYNCVVYFNSATSDPNYDSLNSSLNFCCTTPPFTNGLGNITNQPLFLDYTNGNLRLQSNSPCINAGNNGYVANTTDLDGRPRIISGSVDMGAYEFQGPFNDWLQQYALATDGSADFTDPDNDGLNNYQESVTGTDPTNSISVLQMLSPTTDLSGVVVRWQSVSNRTYFVERASSLAGPAPFSTIASNVPGQPGTTSYTDTNAPGPFFYRVGVQP